MAGSIMNKIRNMQFPFGTYQPQSVCGSLPWWKQRRVICQIVAGGAICIIGVITVASIFGTRRQAARLSNEDNQISAISSALPSNLPTTFPTDFPSGLPTSSPTQFPSSVPSTPAPSLTASDGPSVGPSAMPTTSPSSRPSHRPSSVPSLFPTSSPSSSPTALTLPRIGFFLIGDVPYAPWEEVVLQDQMLNMTNQVAKDYEHLQFLAHVGDFQRPVRSQCRFSAYQSAQRLMLQSPVAPFVLAGDNDYSDCPDRNEAYASYLWHFPYLERMFDHSLDIRRFLNRPEIFAFDIANVLFVGIFLINAKPTTGGRALRQWNEVMKNNVDWFIQNVEEHTPEGLRGVVIFGHSVRSPDTFPFFRDISKAFLADGRRLNTPVLYLHGDGHHWEVDLRLARELNWPEFRNIQVDQGAFADPCIVEVAPVVEGRMIPLRRTRDLQYIFGNGLFRIDRQRGRIR